MNNRFHPPGNSRPAVRTWRLVGGLVLLGALAQAQVLRVPWYTLNCGGQPVNNTAYSLNGSVAQPVIGSGVSSNGTGWWGFWCGIAPVARRIDVGVTAIRAPVGVIDTLSPVFPAARVKNFGNRLASFTAYFRIDDGSTYSESLSFAMLAPGDSVTAVFAQWALPHPLGSHATCCSTYITDDTNRYNDCCYDSVQVVAELPQLGWVRKANVPFGPAIKRVKDGGCIATADEGDTACVYALKGNNRLEFYRYNNATNGWTARESVPAIGRSGKKKTIKKGACMAQAGGKIYAAKGNGTWEFWCYDPETGVFTSGRGAVNKPNAPAASGSYPWTQLADIPGSAKVKQGAGLAAVTVGGQPYLYLLKGSSTIDFYRYNISTNSWETRADAPVGLSGKTYKSGSCISFDEDRFVYALKGTYNEFAAYDVARNVWTTRTAIPFMGLGGRKRKVQDGAGLAFHNGLAYALKGGNTQEFWSYRVDSNNWYQKDFLPIGDGKRVKAGGALAYSPGANALFALKGNNTVEFWKYSLTIQDSPHEPGAPDNVQSAGERMAEFGLRVTPNPFAGAATVSFSLPRASRVSIRLFDVSGKLIRTLAAGARPSGTSSFVIQPSALPSGIYLLRLDSDDGGLTRKVLVQH